MARLSFRCGEDVVGRVDAVRFGEPREAWLRRVVLEAVEREESSVRMAEMIGRRKEPMTVAKAGEALKALVPARELLEQPSPLASLSRPQHAPTCRCPVCS